MFETANLCDATWENITKVRLQKFVDYMGERLLPNSVNQYATKQKAVLNLYSDEISLPRGFAKVLTPKKTAVQNVYLTETGIVQQIGLWVMCVAVSGNCRRRQKNTSQGSNKAKGAGVESLRPSFFRFQLSPRPYTIPAL